MFSLNDTMHYYLCPGFTDMRKGISSLLATCRNHNVNPREYLNDIIARLPYMQKATHEQLTELLPHKWQPIDDIYKLYNAGIVKQDRLKL